MSSAASGEPSDSESALLSPDPTHAEPGKGAVPPEQPAGAGWRKPSVSGLAYRYAILLAWVAVIIIFGALRPGTFLTAGNFQIIFGSQAVLLILTLGLLFPLAAGEFDLSIGGVIGFACMLTAVLNVNDHVPVVFAALLVIAAGLVIGAVNSFFIVKLKIHSFIITLGMGTLLTGLTYGISNSVTIGGVSQQLVNVMQTNGPLGLPLLFYYALALTLLVWYLFSHTPLGRYFLFVGLGRDVARLTGVRVDALRVLALIVCSVVASLAGIGLAGSLGAADPTVGDTYLLPAFAAAFLGSTAIQPDRFNPWGAFLAVYFLVTGITGLELLGYSGWVEQVFYGGALVAAVTFSRLVSLKKQTAG